MRLRLTFQKTEAMRYTSHLDLYRTWERTLRRARLPLAYTQGFSPHPRLNLGAALPLGFTSECEVIDIWLDEEFSSEQVSQALQPALPPGLVVTHIEPIANNAPALQQEIQAAEYLITLLDPCPDLAERLEKLCAAEHLPRERRGKSYDLRSLIQRVELLPPQDELPRFLICLSAREGATGRPEEVLAEMGFAPHAARIHRKRLLLHHSVES